MSLAADDVRAQARAAVEWARCNPVEWCRKFLRVEPDIWQQELMEAVADLWRVKVGVPTRVNHNGKNLITIRAMHGPGKTFGCALVMHWFGYCWRTLSPCTAPKEKQLKTRLWPAFRKAMRDALPGYAQLLEVGMSSITWHKDPDWSFVAETAASPENLAGYHDDFMLIVVDEASGMSEDMFPALEGALSTGTLVCMVLIGNPTKNVGTFYDSHMRDVVARHYHRIHVSLEKTTRVSREWVQRMVDKYGANSPVVQVRCYGNFADTDELQLIALQWLVDAFDRDFDELYDGSHPRHRISVDVADGGADASVVTRSAHYQSFTHHVRQTQYHYPSSRASILLADEVERIWKAEGLTPDNADIVVDAVGVGAGCAGALMVKGLPVIAYKGGSTQDVDTQEHRNHRVRSYYALRNDLRDGRCLFAPGFFGGRDEADESVERSEFEAQVCSVRMNANSGERVEDLETKQQMRTQNLKSPDRADSLAMQYAGVMPRLEGRVLAALNMESTMMVAHSEAARGGW